MFLLGPSGAGKTTAGRELAAKYGIFHISFRQYLHELIAPKLKKLFIGEENYDDDSVPGVCACVCLCMYRPVFVLASVLTLTFGAHILRCMYIQCQSVQAETAVSWLCWTPTSAQPSGVSL